MFAEVPGVCGKGAGVDLSWQFLFVCFFTFSLHFLMVDVSSLTTISTHFRLGSFNFCTCFFTMASKARSGVKRPVLHGRAGWEEATRKEEAKQRKSRKEEEREGRKREKRENTRQNEK